MKNNRRLTPTIAAALLSAALLFSPASASPNAAEKLPETIQMAPFHQVQMDDIIWKPRIQKLVAKTLPHAFKQTEVAQERLRLCAEYLESGGRTKKPDPHRFNTSDLYKVMEGGALMLHSAPNAEIEAMMDRIIDVIARAQKDDGYLYVSHITDSIYPNEMGKRPYSYVVHSHELYNVGHLYEAAVAYAQATGKTKFLDIAEKSAQHVNRVIFQGDPNYNDGKPVMQAPGHEEIELALVKLYRYTGKRLYLDMAKRFLDIRGVTFVPKGKGVNSPTYAQQHAPVVEQTEAVGHAVRATYLYTAMAEVDSLTGNGDYTEALDAIWSDLVDKKMHLTGGLGAVHGVEGFGPAYMLPNKDTYLETCAAVGNVFFNMRMFLKYQDAKYLDVAEVALLNNCLSGIGLDGTSFFYPNPLEADNGHKPRSGWFGCACCPSNIARLIPQVSGFLYATSGGDNVYCALYGASSTSLKLKEGQVTIKQTTEYPRMGGVHLEIAPEKPMDFTLRMRVPTWAEDQFVPGDLYSYTNHRHHLDSKPKRGWSLKINGEEMKPPIEKGFVVIKRKWKAGDRVFLSLKMPLKANVCNDRVEANRDRVAFSRGPLVYCAEGVDNGGAVQRFFVDPARAILTGDAVMAEFVDMLEFCVAADELVTKETVSEGRGLRLIPYFAWSNRGRSSMMTWFGTNKSLAKPDMTLPENRKFFGLKASHTFENDTVNAVQIPHTPESSRDDSIPRWTSWPQRGKPQWVQVDLNPEAKAVTSVGVYFYNDNGGVQLPGSWNLEIPLGGGKWKKVEIYNTDQYSTLPDVYNTVHPAKPLTGSVFRIVMEPKHGETCVGILSVNVETQ